MEFTNCKCWELSGWSLRIVNAGSSDDGGDAMDAMQAMLNKCTICLLILRTIKIIYHNFIYFL